MSRDEVKEQILYTDKAIRELKKQRFQLLEQDGDVEELTLEIDKLMKKLARLSLQYSFLEYEGEMDHGIN